MDKIQKYYPNTPEGVALFLKHETPFGPTEATLLIPDPLLSGVWQVTDCEDVVGNRRTLRIYMAGYKDGSGVYRRKNDFAQGYCMKYPAKGE